MTFVETLTGWDHSIFHWINGELSNPFFDWLMPSTTDMHKEMVFKILAPLFLFGFLYWKKRLSGIFLGFSLIFFLALDDFIGGRLKHVFERVRPFNLEKFEMVRRADVGSFSFPSNHAMNMFCFATFLSYFFPRAKIPLFLVAIHIAFSRVYLGVHFPSDVLVAALFGSIIGYSGARLSEKAIQWRKS